MISEVTDPTPDQERVSVTPERSIAMLGYVMLSDEQHEQMRAGFHSDEFTGNEDQRLAALRSLSYDDFRQRISVVNGLLPKSDSGSGDSEDSPVVIKTAMGALAYIPPDEEDKEPLLAEMFELAQRTDDVQDSALILGLAIPAIHPFKDGNGRTSRFVYDELAGEFGRGRGLDARHTLTETYGRKNINLGYRLPEGWALRFVEQSQFGMDHDDPGTPHGVDIASTLRRQIKEKSLSINGLDEEQNDALVQALSVRDSTFLLGSMYRALADNGTLEECLLDDGDNIKVIDAEKALAMLEPDALNEMMQGYRQTKIEYVRTLCDAILHPDDYPITVAGAPMTLKSLIINNTINYLVSRRTFHRPK